MKKNVLLFILPLILSGCVKKENDDYSGRTLVIYNVEDYISNGEDDCVDLIEKFEELYNCEVKYYTYDTNETMYNQYKLQKEGTYDLVLASEYMCQKMIKEGLVDKYEDFATHIPNYENNASKILREKLRNMEVSIDGNTVNLDQYTLGYMWGTLGIVYDPNCSDTIEEDVHSWDVFYNTKYKDLISIKNSMRDAYDVGLLHGYSKDEKLQNLIAQNNILNSDESRAALNAYIQDIFDFKLDGSESSDLENISKIEMVKQELITLKQNIFGLETDSGKNDIVEGSKIKMNLAYSGDAVYSIQCAKEDADKELKYYVPDDGGNIWYDAWMLPKGSKNRDLAYEFLNFISDSENAAANMDYIGYTPFIVGDEMFTTACCYYGAAEFDETQTYYEGDHVIYNGVLYECIVEEISEELPTSESFVCNEYVSNEEYEEYDMVSKDGTIYYVCDDELIEATGYDISHIYGDSLENRDAIIYPYYECINLLETQYPSVNVIARCGVMNDYGEYNDKVIIMWGQVKAYANMTPYYIILIIFLVICLGLLAYRLISRNLSSRYKRNISKKGAK